MLPPIPQVPAAPPPPESCCTRLLSSERAIQCVKSTFWSLASLGCRLVPVQHLNVGLSGAALFMSLHALIRHPDSNCMQGVNRQTILSRTWKHLAAGVTVTGTISTLSSIFLQKDPWLASCALIGGIFYGLHIAHPDRPVFCPLGPDREPNEIELDQPEAEDDSPLIV